MNRLDPFFDLGVVDAHVVRIVDHQRRRARPDRRLELVERRVAVLFQAERDHLEPGGVGGRRRAGVALDRGDDLIALGQLPPAGVIGAGDAGMGVGGVGPAASLEHELIHPGQFAQHVVKVGVDFQDALQRVRMLKRVDLRQLIGRDRTLADARVVFHRAGAEQRDAHHAKGHLAEMQVMAQRVMFRHLRQHRTGLAQCARRQVGDRPGIREHGATAARAAQLHHHGLGPSGGMVTLEPGVGAVGYRCGHVRGSSSARQRDDRCLGRCGFR